MDCRIIIFVVEKIEFYMSCKTTAHMSIPGVNIELNVGSHRHGSSVVRRSENPQIQKNKDNFKLSRIS